MIFFLFLLKNIDCGYTEAVLTHTQKKNLCFRAKIRKKCIPSVNPSFTIYKWGVRGSSLHGYVFVMA